MNNSGAFKKDGSLPVLIKPEANKNIPEKAIKDKIRHRRPGLPVKIEYVEEIPEAPGGKFVCFQSDLK